MDREIQMKDVPTYLIEFQLGHFLAEMDRAAILRPLQLSK